MELRLLKRQVRLARQFLRLLSLRLLEAEGELIMKRREEGTGEEIRFHVTIRTVQQLLRGET